MLCAAYLTHTYAMCDTDAGHMVIEHTHDLKHHNTQDGLTSITPATSVFGLCFFHHKIRIPKRYSLG